MSTQSLKSYLKTWTPSKLPQLTGKLYVITGGNSGIGYEAARLLGEAGANIVLACRSEDKAKAAASELQNTVRGTVETLKLDLSHGQSIRAAAARLKTKHSKIDGLINNAGIMQTPQLKTHDGFEMQVGTNHLGHFLWTSLLIDAVEAAKGRVVVVASIAHKFGAMNFDDYMSEHNYDPMKAYIQSKLSNVMFAQELNKRLQAQSLNTRCVACHPGYSATNLQSTGPEGMYKFIYKLTNLLIAQRSEKGAWPTVFAAADPSAEAGAYYGPQGMGEARGYLGPAIIAEHAQKPEQWTKLWHMSEELLDIRWPLGLSN